MFIDVDMLLESSFQSCLPKFIEYVNLEIRRFFTKIQIFNPAFSVHLRVEVTVQRRKWARVTKSAL